MGIDAEMFVRTRMPPNEKELRKLSYDLCAAFGRDQFMVSPPGHQYTYTPHHALEIVDKWEQDGPDIHPEPGESFIRCYIWTRYYGPGYERGDLPLIISVARWLEVRIKGSVVWYGGDSSGILAEPFDRERQEDLWLYFVTRGHAPYYANEGFTYRATECSFCANTPMAMHMGSSKATGYVCHGCGLHRLIGHDSSVVDTYDGWYGEDKAVLPKSAP